MNRSVLMGSYLILATLAFVPLRVSSQVKEGSALPEADAKMARDIFRELVEMNTSVTQGCTRAAQAMATRLQQAGFPDQDVRLLGPHPLHMNLVVRYRGQGTLRPILLIGHLDVVAALRQDWSMDPFTFAEKDGYFYGRGTTDMKNEDADLVANLIRLKREGFKPNRDIVVALTEDEENGDANGIQWLLRNHRELIDAEYCLNLDSGGGEIKKGKHITMDVQTGEKIYMDLRFEVRNKGGHSSLPVPDNAIYRLAAALSRVAQYEFPVRLNETTRLFFERNAEQETGRTKADMLAMNHRPLDTAAAARLAYSSPFYNSMMRTTCVATMLSGGHAPNALPQLATANVNCRMLPDDTQEHVIATLRAVVADTNVHIACVDNPTPAPFSPLRKDVMDAVERVTAAMWPGVVVTPVMSTGASDGKMLRAAGIPVYGVSGMFGDIDDVRAHGRDERIGVREFYEGVEFMYNIIKALSSGQ